MKQWYALRSKPKKEMAAAAMLSKAEIEAYVPQMTVRRGLSRTSSPTPFFPNYLFARLDPQEGEIGVASRTPGVQYVVSYGDQPCPVPDGLVELIKERLESYSGHGYLSDLRPGDRVLLTRGPLRDTEAIFHQHLSATGRVQVLVQMLQRLCRVDVRVDQLRLLRKAAGTGRA